MLCVTRSQKLTHLASPVDGGDGGGGPPSVWATSGPGAAPSSTSSPERRRAARTVLAAALGVPAALAVLGLAFGTGSVTEPEGLAAAYLGVGVVALSGLAAVLWALLRLHGDRHGRGGPAMIIAGVALGNGVLSVFLPLWAIFVFLAAVILLVPLGCVALGALLVALTGLAGRTSEGALVDATAVVGWISAFVFLPVAGGFAMLSVL